MPPEITLTPTVLPTGWIATCDELPREYWGATAAEAATALVRASARESIAEGAAE